ncbi:MAG: FAD-dependent oxidoreductase [Planctomycetota bacterium]
MKQTFPFIVFLIGVAFYVADASALQEIQPTQQRDLLVEAESFSNHGGWKLDTQFIDEMGSPYLLAHGLGRPIDDATTKVTFPSKGTYNVWVRTKDWVARWGATGAPGKFQLKIDGQPLKPTFGTESANWQWQSGGTVTVNRNEVELALKDLTGFDGRCDAIYFSLDEDRPPNDETLSSWRFKKLGLDSQPTPMNGYDLVVVGGGYSGMGTAISAARMGCKVALIQNRGVLGGNGSSEVRVWAMGNIRRGKYPRIGEIINEFADNATKSPGRFEEFGDATKEAIVRAEKNIDLFLHHHAYASKTKSSRVVSVTAFDTRTSERKEFFAPLFADCTGHGTLAFLAEAEWEMTPKGRMGMSNMWAWDELDQPTSFPKTDDWALDLDMKDFPYPRDHHGQWFWESGFDKDPLKDAEGIRDWNLRAVYGAFNAMKNRDGSAKHQTAVLTWIAYVGGPRESRRVMGDVVLTKDDIVEKREFKDGCVPTTWSIDLHYPKKQFAAKFPDNPFISIAEHDRRVDRNYGYPVPYRCFYSKNIENLFVAGRCVSVTHEALGTVRVMKTCGMMGEVVGKAASICRKHDCLPRAVYQQYWDEMDQLLQLPGGARRQHFDGNVQMPKVILPIPGGPVKLKLAGLAMDNSQAKSTGSWSSGTGLKGYFGDGYQYAAGGSNGTMAFRFKIKKAQRYDIRISWRHHENRASNAKVKVIANGQAKTYEVDMQKEPELDGKFESLATLKLDADSFCIVLFDASDANGFVCTDAVQLLPVENDE